LPASPTLRHSSVIMGSMKENSPLCAVRLGPATGNVAAPVSKLLFPRRSTDPATVEPGDYPLGIRSTVAAALDAVVLLPFLQAKPSPWCRRLARSPPVVSVEAKPSQPVGSPTLAKMFHAKAPGQAVEVCSPVTSTPLFLAVIESRKCRAFCPSPLPLSPGSCPPLRP